MLGLTAGVVLGMAYLQEGLNALVHTHQWLASSLNIIFRNDVWGFFLKQFFAFLLIPVIIGGFCSFIYWLFKKSNHMPFLWHIMWAVWLVLTVAVVGCV
jgi:hypothetical protein